MTAPTESPKASLGGLPAAFMNLANAQMRFGADLYESLTSQPVPTLAGLKKASRQFMPGMAECWPAIQGCCNIPPPCWMPRFLGECTSHVSQCRTACIRFVVTNCDRVKRAIHVQVAGPNASEVTVSPASITVEPMERAAVTACVEIEEDAKVGEKVESLIWVRGCKEYYFRWTVSVGTVGLDSCHEVEVCDCPDYIHHWYDHFYCVRPCPHREADVGRTPGTPVANPVKTHG